MVDVYENQGIKVDAMVEKLKVKKYKGNAIGIYSSGKHTGRADRGN